MKVRTEMRFGLASAFLLVCWPMVSAADGGLKNGELVRHYSDLYAGVKGDFAVALPNHRSVSKLDGSLDSLTFVDAHLLAINGTIYHQGWDSVPFYEVQQAVIGASAYVNTTLVALGAGSIQIVEQKVSVPYDFGDAAFGIGLGLSKDSTQVFPTDCLVSQLLLLGETSQRISSAADEFLNGGAVPTCTWSEDQ